MKILEEYLGIEYNEKILFLISYTGTGMMKNVSIFRNIQYGHNK